MGSAVSERHITNGRNHLSVQSDVCWQNQPFQVKLGGFNLGALGHLDSNRGILHPLTSVPHQQFPSSNPHMSTEDSKTLEEEITSLLQK